jgi:hypothetical protein
MEITGGPGAVAGASGLCVGPASEHALARASRVPLCSGPCCFARFGRGLSRTSVRERMLMHRIATGRTRRVVHRIATGRTRRVVHGGLY